MSSGAIETKKKKKLNRKVFVNQLKINTQANKHRPISSTTTTSSNELRISKMDKLEPLMIIPICKYNNKSNRCTSLISICSLLVLVISINLPQFSYCQTATTTTNTKCNHVHRNNHHQQRQQHQLPALSLSNARDRRPPSNGQQWDAPTLAKLNRNAKLINLGPDATEQQAPVSRQAADQQQLANVSEEFSLALGSGQTVVASHLGESNSTGYNLVQPQQQEDENQRAASGNGESATFDSPQLDQTNNKSQAASLDSQQQQQQVANTTPTLMSVDSINSPPVVPQPPPTTTSSLINQNRQPQQSDQLASTQPSATTTTSSLAVVGRQQQASGRRMDEHNRGHSVGDGHASSLSSQQPQAGSPYAISSSPTSVSIITPLLNPLLQQQQQQQQQQHSSSSSMIKPITVVGNPISELDYTSATVSSAPTELSNTPAATNQQQQMNSVHMHHLPSGRSEKRVDQIGAGPTFPNVTPSLLSDQQQQPAVGNNNNNTNQQQPASAAPSPTEDRMSGPTLFYTDGHLSSTTNGLQQQQQSSSSNNSSSLPPANVEQQQQQQQQVAAAAAAARLLQTTSQQQQSNAAVLANNPRRPSLPPPVNQANAASGFRSPMSPSGPLVGQPANPANTQILQQQQPTASQNSLSLLQPTASQNSLSLLQPPINSLNNLQVQGQSSVPVMPNFYQTSAPYVNQLFVPSGGGGAQLAQPTAIGSNMQRQAYNAAQQQQQQPAAQMMTNVQPTSQGIGTATPASTSLATYQARRPLNITRVEHISAECSNDLIRAVIVFNGTFKGIIYSSGYVNDPTCLYVNGTGSTRYEFSIRLNQCGTLGRQELHQPTIPGEARRRDQVMWNTLSIQYNSIIEQEWDEHFRVSCEYGSDFWKTVSFSPFNVETNTGSPVVFTINPPQCQMDVLLGHGMGPKIAVDGPVTVGDPLTLLIHMKSEKAGYDILVKNCVAHNGGKQRMQLIDSNGCVVNERFISPFRGTYNDNDLRHVTLYAYLKAFRFTGSPVLYLECEIHMCQSACPPQMCYWRRLSKRSVDNSDFEYTDDRLASSGRNSSASSADNDNVVSDSLSLFKALQVRHEPIEPERARRRTQQLEELYAEDDEAQLVCYRHTEVLVFLLTTGSLLVLILSVALTCCWRIRKLTRASGQYEHNRLKQAASLSPSLLSISDGLASSHSSGSSFYSGGASSVSVGSQLGSGGFPKNHKPANGRSCYVKQQQQTNNRTSQYQQKPHSDSPLAPRGYIFCNQ